MSTLSKLLARLSLCAFLAVPATSAFADVTKMAAAIESTDTGSSQPVEPMLLDVDVTKV